MPSLYCSHSTVSGLVRLLTVRAVEAAGAEGQEEVAEGGTGPSEPRPSERAEEGKTGVRSKGPEEEDEEEVVDWDVCDEGTEGDGVINGEVERGFAESRGDDLRTCGFGNNLE